MILRLRNFGHALLPRALGFPLPFISSWTVADRAEPAVKIDVGAAFRAKRAGGKNGRLAADRTGPERCSVWLFIKTGFRIYDWHDSAGAWVRGAIIPCSTKKHAPESLRRQAATWSRRAADRRPRNRTQ